MCVRCKKLKLCDCVHCGMQPTYDACGVAPSVAMLKNKSSKQYIQNSCGEAQPPLDENYEKGNAGGGGEFAADAPGELDYSKRRRQLGVIIISAACSRLRLEGKE